MNNNESYPQSFRVWRRLMQVVCALFFFCLASLLPYALASGSSAESTVRLLLRVSNISLIWTILSLILACLLGLGGVLFGLRMTTRLPPKPDALHPVSRTQYLRPVGLAVGLFACTIFGLAYAAVTYGNTLASAFYPYATCVYRVAVVAYEDRDGNGLRDVSEPGLPGVAFAVKPGAALAIQSQTGADGSGTVQNAEYSCAQSLETGSNGQPAPNQIGVNVQAPAGYAATTELSFGPFTANWTSNPPTHVVYVGFQKKP